MRTSYLTLIAIFLVGCQTTRVALQDVPLKLQGMFGQCYDLGGAVYLRAAHNNQTLFAAQSDWLAKTKRQWVVESYSSFGQTVGRIEGRSLDRQLKVSLPTVDPKVFAVDDEGRITYQGYYTGLVIGEIPCLIAGRLPQSWLSAIIELKFQGKGATLTLNHQDRDISLFIEDYRSDSPSYCGFFNWSNYIGLVKSQFEYCLLGAKNKFIIKFDSGVVLEWSPIASI